MAYHLKNHGGDYRRLGGANQEAPCLSTLLIMILIFVGLLSAIVWNLVYNNCRQSITIPLLCFSVLVVSWILLGVLAITLQRGDYMDIFKLIAAGFFMGSLVYFFCVLIIAGDNTGHDVPGLSYKEYHLHDYSSWITKQVNNNRSWERYRSCIVKSGDCDDVASKYKYENLELETTVLTPVEAGCCRPPSMCGYPPVNASFYNLSVPPASVGIDCKLYKNLEDTKCYNCNSCKAGVAETVHRELKVTMLGVYFFMVFLLLTCACIVKS